MQSLKQFYYKIRSNMKTGAVKLLHSSFLRNRLNFTYSTNRQGVNLRIPVVNGVGYDNIIGNLEPWMTEVLRRTTAWKEGGIIDVGVNIGQTLIKYKTVNPKGNYVGFEANPECFSYLGTLEKENNFDDTIIVPVGLSNSTNLVTLDFFAETKTDSGASVIPNFRPQARVFRKRHVSVFSWGNVVRDIDIGNAEVVKIDVEGAELEVFEGMRTWISSHHPAMIFEILPVGSSDVRSRRKQRQERIMTILDEINYQVWRVIKTDINRLQGIDLIDDFGTHSDLTKCDYLAVHNDDAIDFGNLF